MSYDRRKRLFDLAVAALVLLVTAPLYAAAALAIKLTSPGPIHYCGLRVGRGGTPFRMIKFRSMIASADRAGVWSTAVGDARITRVGHLLRRSKLDELPQMWNVLRGEMSLVGPRPQVPADVAKYSAAERGLLTVRPGITDWASIYFRNEGDILAGESDPDEAYDRLIRPTKSRLGLRYVSQRSFRVDLAILVETARVALGLPGVTAAANKSTLEKAHDL